MPQIQAWIILSILHPGSHHCWYVFHHCYCCSHFLHLFHYPFLLIEHHYCQCLLLLGYYCIQPILSSSSLNSISLRSYCSATISSFDVCSVAPSEGLSIVHWVSLIWILRSLSAAFNSFMIYSSLFSSSVFSLFPFSSGIKSVSLSMGLLVDTVFEFSFHFVLCSSSVIYVICAVFFVGPFLRPLYLAGISSCSSFYPISPYSAFFFCNAISPPAMSSVYEFSRFLYFVFDHQVQFLVLWPLSHSLIFPCFLVLIVIMLLSFVSLSSSSSSSSVLFPIFHWSHHLPLLMNSE